MKCLIILNGDKPSNIELDKHILDKDYVICADGGARWAHEADVKVNAIIGDLDSISDDVRSQYEKKNTRIIKAPQEKDETDGVLAIDYALLKGATSITIIGAIGGRLDHQYGNLMLLKRVLDAKCKGKMVLDGGFCIMSNSYTNLKCQKGDTVSVVPFDGELVIRSSIGLKYSMDANTIFKYSYPIGISNVATDDKVSMDISAGCALIFCYNS